MLAGVRYGAIARVTAFASTLATNLAIVVFRPTDLCRVGPISIILLDLGAAFQLRSRRRSGWFLVGFS